ncbi:MAG: adenine phosphoribosyltransferase [Pseudomonadota bacterium]
MDLKAHIRTIPDYPKPGIMFRDVSTLMGHAGAFRAAITQMADPYRGQGVQKVAGIDARGFILGGAMAYRMGLPFVPVRKKGKLPSTVLSEAYSLEYGEAIVEIHADAVSTGQRVLLVDDLLATGGTAAAGVRLLRRLEAQVVGAVFLVNLPDLGGGKRLDELGIDVKALCSFDGD